MNDSKCLRYAVLLSGIFTLILVMLYCNVFPRDFTTNSLDMRKFSSMSSFEERKAEDNLDLDHSEGKKDETNVGYSNTVDQQSHFQSNTIQTGFWKPLPGQKNVQAIENLKPVKYNVSSLSYIERRIKTEQQLRDTIRIHHDKNFIQPKNETCEKRFPICILIGVNKCGTRELVDFLNLHPHIETYPSTLKKYEMPYFTSKYKEGDVWFQSQMPFTYSNQITLIKHAGYFHRSVVPQRIKQFNESIKLILMVREPVARSVSNYMMTRNNFLEHPEKIKLIMYNKNNFSWFALNSNSSVKETKKVVKHSVYDKPMKLWLKYFNLSQFLIMDNEELKHDPVSTLKKVERFLGLEHFISDEMFVWKKDKGFYCVRSNITDNEMACYSENRGHQKHIVVSEKTLSKLSDYFKSKNRQFFEIIGRSFDW